MIFNNKLTYVFPFFIASRPFPVAAWSVGFALHMAARDATVGVGTEKWIRAERNGR